MEAQASPPPADWGESCRQSRRGPRSPGKLPGAASQSLARARRGDPGTHSARREAQCAGQGLGVLPSAAQLRTRSKLSSRSLAPALRLLRRRRPGPGSALRECRAGAGPELGPGAPSKLLGWCRAGANTRQIRKRERTLGNKCALETKHSLRACGPGSCAGPSLRVLGAPAGPALRVLGASRPVLTPSPRLHGL